MSIGLIEPLHHHSTSPAERLRTTMAAVRVSVSWLDTKKSLTAEQKAEAAAPFGTDARFFSAGDYPESLRGMFSVEFDFPSVQTPDYLQQLNPVLYEEECRRFLLPTRNCPIELRRDPHGPAPGRGAKRPAATLGRLQVPCRARGELRASGQPVGPG